MPTIVEAHQKHLTLFRVLSLLGGLLILALGLLNRGLNLAFIDPWPERLAAGLALLLFFALTFVSEPLRKHARPWFYAVLYLVSLWYLHLTYLNSLSFNTTFGLVMIIVGLSLGFQSTRTLALYVVSMSAGATIIASLVAVPEVTPSFFVRTVVVIALVTFFMLRARLKTLEELTTNNERLVREVTERRETEEMLRQSEARYRHMVEHARDVIYQVDTQGRFTYVNPVALRIGGYAEEEALGRHFTDVIRADYRHEALAFYQRQLQERIPSTYYEFPALTSDGSTLWIGQNVQLILGGDQTIGFQAVARDITERKHTEKALQESEQQFRMLFENSPDAIFLEDFEGTVLDVNPMACQLHGLPYEQLIGRNVQSLVPPGKREQVLHDLDKQIRGETDRIEGFSWAADERAVPVEIRISHITHGGQPALLLHVRDITERKRAQETAHQQAERERLIAELEAKNAELERFTYTVSHDLKSPLVTIKGFLGLLEQDALEGNAEGMKRDIEHISHAADKMGHLLSELLELSRIGRLMNLPEAVSLSELAHDAASLVAGRIAARGVSVEIAPEMPEVQGDRVRLLEVYQNLIENAVKFMGDQAEPRVEIGLRKDGEELVFFVKDNGMGIDPKYHENVFGLFNRLDPGMEGTGIGLALVKRIVEVHGGRIWVESKGKGSTFYFTLPGRGEVMEDVG